MKNWIINLKHQYIMNPEPFLLAGIFIVLILSISFVCGLTGSL